LLHPAINTVCGQADVTQTLCWHAADVDADPAADVDRPGRFLERSFWW